MAKIRDKNIVAEAVGYVRPMYRGEPSRVKVLFSGTLSNGNIHGAAFVYLETKDGVKLRGEGRYSFMIGSRGLHNSDPEAPEFQQIAKTVAAAWVKANPNGVYEARLQWAKEDVDAALLKRDTAVEVVEQRRSEYNRALQNLQDVINERDPGR